MTKLGIGIIGCGNISTAYLKLAPLFKGLEVRAVADINMDAAKARAAEFNVKAQSVDDLLANPALDIVINLTIPDAHYPITKRILEAGKHAYSEKPLVLTLEQVLVPAQVPAQVLEQVVHPFHLLLAQASST